MTDYIDIEILKKYDKPGPRYTSYPPAPIFNHAFGSKEYREALIENNSQNPDAELSLYFHIPFCDTLCYFCGCNMVVSRDQKRMREYVKYLTKEMKIIHQSLSPRRLVTQMHWGGGSPSNLSPENIALLAEGVHSMFKFDDDAELGVEIDPRGLTYEHMLALRRAGFNRISMGVQDFDPAIQKLVNRVQSEKITRDAIKWSKELGFNSINIDLIYGFPLQTAKSFSFTLDKIIEFSCERIAVFNFAYVPWMKSHQKLIKKELLPTPDEKLQILKTTIEKLTSAGYVYIGMDHFAKPSDELARAQIEKTLHRNFQGYSTHAGADLYAFGISSISQFQFMYSQNYKRIQEYYRALEANEFPVTCGYRMTHDDRIRKEVIMRIMCDMELEKLYIERKFNISFDKYFQDALVKLQPLASDNFLEITDSKLIVSPLGRLLIRNIAMCFDAYLDQMMKERPIFSRTV